MPFARYKSADVVDVRRTPNVLYQAGDLDTGTGGGYYDANSIAYVEGQPAGIGRSSSVCVRTPPLYPFAVHAPRTFNDVWSAGGGWIPICCGRRWRCSVLRGRRHPHVALWWQPHEPRCTPVH